MLWGTGRMLGTVTEICVFGNPVLRQRAAEVVDPASPDIKQLADDMLATMHASSGVGIAAPQTGHSVRVVIIASTPNSRYPDAPAMEPLIMINPEIVSRSDRMVEGMEGCLSVPGLRLPVSRHLDVDTVWRDLAGSRHQQTFTGFIARIVQHELDHLDGILITDRSPGDERQLPGG